MLLTHYVIIEYKYAIYMIEIFLINVEKLLVIFGIAYIMNILPQTLIMTIAYSFIRQHAFGWHALSSRNCTLLGLLCFVFLPLLLRPFLLRTTILMWLPCLCLSFYINFKHAPADTEKNPLVNVKERSQLKKHVLLKVSLLSVVVVIPVFHAVKPFIVLGMLVQSLMVTPFIYLQTNKKELQKL